MPANEYIASNGTIAIAPPGKKPARRMKYCRNCKKPTYSKKGLCRKCIGELKKRRDPVTKDFLPSEETVERRKHEKKKKIKEFRQFMSDLIGVPPDSLIMDSLEKLATSTNEQMHYKLVDLIIKKLSPEEGEPEAVHPDIVNKLQKLDEYQRKLIEEKK